MIHFGHCDTLAAVKRFYLETISGRRRGPLASMLRAALWIGSIAYVLGHAARRTLYRIGLLRAVKLPIPIISVGNLTSGGTGKTPLVEHLARSLARRNLRTVILARGYGRMGDGRDDEDLQSEMEIEHVVRLTGPDRVASARRALAAFRPDVFLLDDGFQHYRLHRDLDLLVIDATNPFAGGRRIPRGLLRERPAHARRADVVVLTRCDQVEPAGLESLRASIERIAPGKPVVECVHKPVQLRILSTRTRRAPEHLKGRPVYAFCGIGNPEAFRRTLESLGAVIAQFRAFEDHHVYTPRDVQQINAAAQEFMAEMIVTTGKDARKLDAESFPLPISALIVELEIQRGEEFLEARLQALAEERINVAGAAAAP